MDIITRVFTVGVRIFILSFTLKYLHFKNCFAMKILACDLAKTVDFGDFLFINFLMSILSVAP
jgi:hypothetical protein